MRALIALPVYNEVRHVNEVLDAVVDFGHEVLVVNDGSQDGTDGLLTARGDVHIVHHRKNRGYGAALRSAFQFAIDEGYDVVVTIDCDGQHEPQLIPQFIAAAATADIVSGSRYLKQFPGDSEPPAERRSINQQITEEINERLGFSLTDAFCGFKAYRTEALRRLQLTEEGYAMPLELWTQAAAARLRVVELPVPLIYLDAKRTFGGSLDDAATRLQYYRSVLDRSMEAGGLIRAKPLPCGGSGA